MKSDQSINQTLLDLATKIVAKFNESDWKKLAQLTGFKDEVTGHPRLLRSLSWGDSDYLGNVLDMLNDMVDADPGNLDIIQNQVIESGGSVFIQPGRYLLLETLGSGGYGQVHREHDSLIDFDFARKILMPSVFITGDTTSRFLREARMLFRLSHPNIVRVYEVGTQGEGLVYIRMELVEGKRLDEIGVQRPERARHYIYQITSALNHSHGKSVIHRDLKPSNILVNGDDLKVIDFGLGAFIDETDMSLTPSDRSFGGGVFAAPELRTQPRTRDPRVDIFSIGALWYFMLTGRAPLGDGIFEQLDSVTTLPKREAGLIRKCLAFQPDNRPDSAYELLQLLPEINDLHKVEELNDFTEELSDDEVLVITAFAGSYAYGDTLTSLSIEHSRSRLRDNPVNLGVALMTLEHREFISPELVDDKTGWRLASAGKAWLRRNGARVKSTAVATAEDY